MTIGPNPRRADRMRLDFFEAVTADLVEAMKDLQADDAIDLGDELARVASYFRAEGALKMADLLEPSEDFDAVLCNGLESFTAAPVVDEWRKLMMERLSRRKTRVLSDRPVAVARRQRKAAKLAAAGSASARGKKGEGQVSPSSSQSILARPDAIFSGSVDGHSRARPFDLAESVEVRNAPAEG